MNEAKLNDYLSSLCKSELEKEIVELFKIYPEVKEHYNLKISNKLEESLLEKYRIKIENEFLSSKDRNKTKYSLISQIIMEFQQVSSEPENIVKLMLYYIDMALEFVNSDIEVEESFYLSIEGVFEKALNIIFKNELEEEVEGNIKQLMDKVSNQKYELKENMTNIYSCYY